MDDFPAGVCGTISHALECNLRRYHRRFGTEALPACDLYADIVKALKWVHSVDPERAVTVTRRALTDAASDGGGPPLDAAARCLRHSLTQASVPYGTWTEDQAESFVTAVLLTTV
ncbi:hypothetical protein ACFWOJ_00655 [Streptomyces sp. NPDC058439]|uniref:hypothetical protein n=1 Tax=Streptomyces sp. NPDC058439 TaxID=3346500 RepID=UPI003652BC37